MDVQDVLEFVEELSVDMSMPRNVRAELCNIKDSLGCSSEEVPLRVDAALQKLEEMASDPNISPFNRTEIWNLTSAMESLNATR
tara:strand:+ start:305 stop:556 length:252 start_codon:yes stop_codon:yes gene_type:complete